MERSFFANKLHAEVLKQNVMSCRDRNSSVFCRQAWFSVSCL